jgi:hypothetical protein
MPTLSKRPNFSDSDEGRAVRQQLEVMVEDGSYATRPSYSANAMLYPDHLMPFVDKHMEYLRNHPATNPQHYLSNLRLITRLKQPSP